jgi:hypothetical protein
MCPRPPSACMWGMWGTTGGGHLHRWCSRHSAASALAESAVGDPLGVMACPGLCCVTTYGGRGNSCRQLFCECHALVQLCCRSPWAAHSIPPPPPSTPAVHGA